MTTARVLWIPPENWQLTLTTARRPPDGSLRGKSFLDDLVRDAEGLTDELKPARKPLVRDPLVPHSGMVGFVQHKTHSGGD
jgi:hypothetical protein